MRLLAVLCVAQGLSQWSAVLLPHRPLFDTVTPDMGRGRHFLRHPRSSRGGRIMAGDAVGRRALAVPFGRANLCGADDPIVFLGRLDRRKLRSHPCIFRTDLAGGPAGCEFRAEEAQMSRASGFVAGQAGLHAGRCARALYNLIRSHQARHRRGLPARPPPPTAILPRRSARHAADVLGGVTPAS